MLVFYNLPTTTFADHNMAFLINSLIQWQLYTHANLTQCSSSMAQAGQPRSSVYVPHGRHLLHKAAAHGDSRPASVAHLIIESKEQQTLHRECCSVRNRREKSLCYDRQGAHRRYSLSGGTPFSSGIATVMRRLSCSPLHHTLSQSVHAKQKGQ